MILNRLTPKIDIEYCHASMIDVWTENCINGIEKGIEKFEWMEKTAKTVRINPIVTHIQRYTGIDSTHTILHRRERVKITNKSVDDL